MKNIILISIDDLRFDCMSRYFKKERFAGYKLAHYPDTPCMDSIASSGVSFSRCIAPSSLTPPSHTSMFTGLYPASHEVFTFYDELQKDKATLADILKENGYRTFAKVENAALKLQNITKGIDYIDDILEEGEELFEHLESRKDLNDSKNFIFIHVFDCHSPYGFIKGKGNDKYRSYFIDHIKDICGKNGIDFSVVLKSSEDKVRLICKDYDGKSPYVRSLNEMRALEYALKDVLRRKGKKIFYDTTISSYIWGINLFDRIKLRGMIDRLRGLGLLDDSLLVVTSDHGEAKQVLEGDMYFSNSYNLYEGHIRVPLMFCGEDIETPKEVSQVVSLVDVAPTILDMAGIDVDSSRFDGISLKNVMSSSGNEDDTRSVFGECWAYMGGFNQFGQVGWQGKKGFKRISMVRNKDFKLTKVGSTVDLADMTGLRTRNFIEGLYNDVLGRFPNIYEVILWNWLIEKEGMPKEEALELFTRAIARVRGDHVLIDVENDPDDEKNLFHDNAYSGAKNSLLGLLETYDQKGRGKAEAAGCTDEEKIKEHLRTLGYL